MRGHGERVRDRRRTRGQAALTVLALCATLALTGCGGDDEDAGAGAAGPSASATPSVTATPTATPSATPAASKSASKPAPSATATGKAKTPAPGSGCDHKMPISPDEVAVYRYTPEGGAHSLIVKHGNWGCAAPGMDAAPFDVVGKETFLNIAEDAKITAVTPVVDSPLSQPITLQQLIDWLAAHPDQGRVFRYHLNGAGVIDWMDQEYTSS
ncbi:hypothetical protein ACWGDE_15920 [Streptomyces sp. NPDC054956]